MQLNIIVKDNTDYNKIISIEGNRYKINAALQKQIAEEYCKLLRKYNGEILDVRSLWVICTNFGDEIRAEVNYVAHKNARKILKEKFPVANIWQIHTCFGAVAVFYKTEKDKEFNRKNGISEKIAQTYLSIIEEYDEFGFFDKCGCDFIQFDSKENLKKNYQGNLFYYFR